MPQGLYTRVRPPDHTGTYVVPQGVNQVVLTVTPLSASNGDIDSSNLLDDVKLCN